MNTIIIIIVKINCCSGKRERRRRLPSQRRPRERCPSARSQNVRSIYVCACPRCAGAMLIFSVSFQFQWMIPEGNPICVYMLLLCVVCMLFICWLSCLFVPLVISRSIWFSCLVVVYIRFNVQSRLRKLRLHTFRPSGTSETRFEEVAYDLYVYYTCIYIYIYTYRERYR